jgi:hypothetical protein
VNVVVYSDDMEPITVLDLPLEVLDKAAADGSVSLKIRGKSTRFGDQVCVLKYREVLTWDGQLCSVLITEQEAAVMLAKPGWLPGQRGQLNYYLNRIKNLGAQRRE